jgi:hypothetical protein
MRSSTFFDNAGATIFEKTISGTAFETTFNAI